MNQKSSLIRILKSVQRALTSDMERSQRSDEQEFFQLLSYKGGVNLEAKPDEWERFYNFAKRNGANNRQTPYEALRDKLQ